MIGWVGLAWLAPLIGSIAYFVLGINRVQRKAAKLYPKGSWDDSFQISPSDLVDKEDFTRFRPTAKSLANAGRRLSDQQLLPGNHVQTLIDGDEAYPAMLQAIEEAEHSVALLSYIFDNDRVGEQFLKALVKATERGIEVRVLIDSVGANYTKPTMIKRLRESGVTVAEFLPTRWSGFAKYANMRNHRKIMVCDGRIGFTGGTNIRAGHCLNLKPDYPAQCLHFQLVGPVVAQMQRVFAIDWAFATGEKIAGGKWFPKLERAGEVWARGCEDGPDDKFEVLENMITAAIASAQNRIRVLSPYFLPNASLIKALNIASLRGVDVEIYIPSENNIMFVQWACTAQLWQILEKGCRVFYTPPPFDHTKLMIVDDYWSLIGSTNWDPRSLRLNFEFNVECFSSILAGELSQIVDWKAKEATEITLEHVNARPISIQFRDGLSRLLSPYL